MWVYGRLTTFVSAVNLGGRQLPAAWPHTFGDTLGGVFLPKCRDATPESFWILLLRYITR